MTLELIEQPTIVEIVGPNTDLVTFDQTTILEMGGGGGGSGGGTSWQGVNHQTGTFYTVNLVTDKEKLITLNNTAPISVVIPSTDILADSYDIDPSYYAIHTHLCSGLPPLATQTGQSFTPSVSGPISKAKFFIQRNGTPPPTAVAKLYAHTGTYGFNSQPGALLATSDPIDTSTVSTTGELTTFIFSTSYNLVAGTHYLITISCVGVGDLSNCLVSAEDETLNTHSGNEVDEQTDGWHYNSGEECIFYVYVDSGVILDDKWFAFFENLGSGLVTISTSDLIDGGSSIALVQDTGVMIACDGNSYYTSRGMGAGGPEVLNVQAAEVIPSYTFITVTGFKANSVNTGHYGKVIGIVQDATSVGFLASAVDEGEITNPSWSWSPGSKLFLNGTTISTTPPSSGFSQMVGVAKNANTIIVKLEPPILL